MGEPAQGTEDKPAVGGGHAGRAGADQSAAADRFGAPGHRQFPAGGNRRQAHDILNSWHSAGHLWAQTSLWLDFVFITTYLMALLHLTRFLMRDRPGIRERKVARWVRSLFITAGLGDVAENILLLNNFNPPTDLVSLAATVCALIKFTGLTLGLAGLVVIRAARRHPLPLG